MIASERLLSVSFPVVLVAGEWLSYRWLHEQLQLREVDNDARFVPFLEHDDIPCPVEIAIVPGTPLIDLVGAARRRSGCSSTFKI